MKKFITITLALTLMVTSAVPAFAAKPTRTKFVKSLSTVATTLEKKHYGYGNNQHTSYYKLKNYSKSKKQGYANCVSYVRYALQHSGYLGKNGNLHSVGQDGFYSNLKKKQYTIIWMHKGNKYIQNQRLSPASSECYGAYYSANSVLNWRGAGYYRTKNGAQGEYPTLEWLQSQRILQKGDIIVQYDNPNVLSEYTAWWQTKDYASGTQSHMLVYTGNGKTKQLAQVGAGTVQNVRKKKNKAWKTLFNAYGITHSNYDYRNRHHNPHVAYIIRLK